MVKTVLTLLLAALFATGLPQPAAAGDIRSSGTQPATNGPPAHVMGARWIAEHERQIATARARKVRVALIGDSLVAGWSRESWAAAWEPRGACNFGIPADRTEHVLWRLRNGILAAIDPDVVLVQVGTNDLKSGDDRRSPEDTAAAIGAIVRTVRVAKPRARIVVMAIFPRQPGYDWIDAAILRTNARLAGLQGEIEGVRVVDIGIHFRGPDALPCTRHMKDDLLHLKPSGYRIWTDCVLDMVDAALDRPAEDNR